MSNYDGFLRTANGRYQHADIVKRHLKHTISSYKQLHLKDENFVYNNGEKRLLICVYGTIPIKYRGKSYNIPISIFLNELHPEYPPITYVKPTSNMELKVGINVDSTGRVFLPYLHNWVKKKSDINGLISKMINIFSETPPVFAKSVTSSPQNNPGGTFNPTPTLSMYPPQTGYPIQNISNTSYPISSSSYNDTDISEQQIRTSLLTAVQDKLQRKVQEIYYQGNAELQTLSRTQTDLEAGKNSLEKNLAKMELEQSLVEKSIVDLKAKNEEMVKVISQIEGKSDVDVDEAIVPAAPIYKQLIDAYSEEQAIEDTLYCLNEALQKNVIDIDTYLKKIRELSRKQFTLKEIVTKCRLTAGLPAI